VWEQSVVLKYQSDPALIGRDMDERRTHQLTADTYVTRGYLFKTRDNPQRSGFSGTAAPQNTYKFSRLHQQVEPPDCRSVGSRVATGDCLEMDNARFR
jgi:hypothetical protein